MLFLFKNFWGVLTIFPFVAFIITFFTVFFWKKQQKKAIMWSVNITNIFLVISVTQIYKGLWPEAVSAWILILLFLLGLAGMLFYLQMKVRGRVSWKKIGFATWRISFILFVFTYFCLFSTGIYKTMQAAHVGLSIM
ncbi:DUF3397 family protein [Brevibacillus laterosporus]|uniref:DUF3397 domain-containing protein n=2 Tax=Brevibacillus laterosporus TaxID=1465 RepID=A0AAP3GD92_BRELA|nr:DUF3397 family protein [Brevibacillus laterosporus]MCR8980339.1 DUF3397 domain-containing protein [Brevibacillus laterosporus]MCZ0807494.1 DUF3397 family protein [Brevibacillus laterosporus]MCZ0825930.1 DUF3397 family protein [Brevibacillus laterosporus]MCZ0849616.1 DUF3397 family protein [Brevibacillus laterosporus]PPB02960.1 DUF3397 domain-containing protein [Brevibacillus laterosporus]